MLFRGKHVFPPPNSNLWLFATILAVPLMALRLNFFMHVEQILIMSKMKFHLKFCSWYILSKFDKNIYSHEIEHQNISLFLKIKCLKMFDLLQFCQKEWMECKIPWFVALFCYLLKRQLYQNMSAASLTSMDMVDSVYCFVLVQL